MIDDTVLVVDADYETEEKIVSALETEGYTVFTASNRDVLTGIAEKISPSLIYLKPASDRVEEFEVCKTIHNMEKYRNVPIILLASLKVPLDSRYIIFYGVVDYLKMPLSSGELIEMTKKILGSRSPGLVEPGKEDIGLMEEESSLTEKNPATVNVDEMPEEETANEKEMPLTQGPAAVAKEFADISEVGQSNEDYSYMDSKEYLRGGLYERNRRRRKQISLVSPVVVVMAVIAIVAAGFLSYKFFSSTSEIKAPVAVLPPKAVQQRKPPVLPHLEQHKQEQPAAEAKPAEIKEVPGGTPAQKNTQAPVAATKPAAKKVYSVQLGAFKSESAAEALVKTYRRKGYEVFTHKRPTNKGTFYKVLIGEFENKKEALRLAVQIETKEKIKTIILSEGTN